MAARIQVLPGGGEVELLIDLGPILQRVGATALAQSQRRFREQKGPRGPWRARGVPNVAGIVSDLTSGGSIKSRRFDARPALVDTGVLRGSLSFRQVGARSVEIGTTVPYASIHQRGGERKIPLPQAMLERLADVLRKARQGARRKGASARTIARNEGLAGLGFLFGLARKGKPLTVAVPERPFIGADAAGVRELEEAVRDGVVAQIRGLGGS